MYLDKSIKKEILMKIKFKNCLLAVLVMLSALICWFLVQFESKTADAQVDGGIEECYAYCANSLEMASTVYEPEKDDLANCLSYDLRDSHGSGREKGGTNLLHVGCRNYKGFNSGYTYGTMDIPYWINMTTFNQIASATNKEVLLNRIRVQTELWNQSYMYDGTGKFINFYEVASDTKPSNINGRPVIEVVAYDFGDENTSGDFVIEDYIVRIAYDFARNAPHSYTQTAAHEFGHALGLADLDKIYDDHSVLMGRNEKFIMNNIIHYQDIQGAAVINGSHTCVDSSFMRYEYEGGYYHHICFYCDRIYSIKSMLTGSKKIMSVCDEKSHDYQPMVSCGNIRWEKCTKCYKVVTINVQEQSDYNVYLFTYGTNSIDENSINLPYGASMPELDEFAPKKTGYAFDGYCDVSGKKYYEMRVVNDEQSASLNGMNTYYVEKPYPVNGVKWYHNEKVTLYPIWKPLECNYIYSNFGDGKILSTTTVLLRHGTNYISPSVISQYTFQYLEYSGRKYTSVPAAINIKLYRASDGDVRPESMLAAYYNKNSNNNNNNCLNEGSLITLANGQQVAVENLTGDEMLLVWNLYTGAYDVAPILFIDRDPLSVYEVISLLFSDGAVVKIISEHGFWDYDLNKYIYLDENAGKYIGHWFNKGDIRVQLIGVEIEKDYTTTYSPVTFGHLCYFVDGMLSMPGGIDGLFNIFDVDADTMRYNRAAMQADVEEYGLFTYEEFAALVPVTEEMFNAVSGQYLKVAIGKGLIDMEELICLAEKYQKFFYYH